MNKTMFQICRDIVGMWIFELGLTIMTDDQLREIFGELFRLRDASRK